jgi:translation elongation factor EF-Ts
VNCETDFVARNDQFKALVSTITGATFNHLTPKLLTATNLSSLDVLISDSILNVSTNEDGDGGSVAACVAKTVGHFQEKISVSRGCTLSCTSGILCGQVHNNISNDETVRMGPYAAVLHMNSYDSTESSSDRANLDELRKLGEQICQHIVGLNPVNVEAVESDVSLVDQNFLFDESVTVGELLTRHRVCVTRFVRYALGEEQENPWTNSSSQS